MQYSTPTTAQIIGTFNKFTDMISLGCKKHGAKPYLVNFPGRMCPICDSRMVEIPDGLIFVYGEQDVREAGEGSGV